MKIFLTFCLIVAVANAVVDQPPHTDVDEIAIIEQRQLGTVIESIRNVIQNLVEKVRKVAKEARDAIGTFTTRVQEEAKQIRERITINIENLNDRVTTAIDVATDKLIDSGAGVVACVANAREEAALLFDQTLTKSLACVNDRIKDVSDKIANLSTIASDAGDFGNQVLEDMRQCTQDRGNILSIGACLSRVAISAEIKVAALATRTTLAVGRISLNLAALPAALELCAATRLVEVGIETTKIIAEVGGCSASTVYTSVTGSGSGSNAV